MELSQCYLECAKLDLSMRDENGYFKILRNKNKNFQVRIIKILPFKKSNDTNDYSIGIKLENLNTKEIKDTDYETLIHYYNID
jgi:N-acetyl-anhydromuramyl-L-alanine amidase AmpD